MPNSYNGSISTLDAFALAFAAVPFAEDVTILDRDVETPILDMAMKHTRSSDGPEITGKFMMTNPDTAEMVYPGERRQYTITQHQKRYVVPWRTGTVKFSALEADVEMALSSGKSEYGLSGDIGAIDRKLGDLKKSNEAGGLTSFCRLLEKQMVGSPASATDDKSMWGFQSCIAKPTAANVALGYNDGFFGWAPTYADGDAMATRANIPVATGPDHENAANANYTNTWGDDGDPMTEKDVTRMIWAKREMGYKPPVLAEQFMTGRYGDMVTMAGKVLIKSSQEKARANNDNLFADLGMYHNTVVIGGAPLMWVPTLDDDTDNPMYFIDFAHFMFIHPSDGMFKNRAPRQIPDIPDTYVWDVDIKGNFACSDTRRLGVISKATT